MAESLERVTLRFMEIAMARFGPSGVLSSRQEASTARAQIERSIAKQLPGQPVVLNFGGVTAISVTFADECIGRLLSSRLAGYDEDHPFLVIDASEEARETLAAALRPRRLAILSVSDGQVELLGADEVLTQTLEAALTLRNFTVHQLAERLDLTPQAANNRLAHLVRSGALRRERIVPSRGGREFRYELPLDELSNAAAATDALTASR